MKLQGTWVGLGGIGLFIQTRLTQILLERNSGDSIESTFKNLLSFLLRSYWQGDKKTKLPDAWDVSSIFRLLNHAVSFFISLRTRGSVLPGLSKDRLRRRHTGCSCVWPQRSLSWAARRKTHVAGIVALSRRPPRHQGPALLPLTDARSSCGLAQLPAHALSSLLHLPSEHPMLTE